MQELKHDSPHDDGTRAWRADGLARIGACGVRAVRALYPGYGVVGLVPPVLIVALMLALLLWVLPPQEAGAQATLRPAGMASNADLAVAR